MSIKPVRTRFAPSPTGHMHIGNARSALYHYLLARRNGRYNLSFELKTPTRNGMSLARNRKLIDGLRWLGLHYDEGPDIGGPYGPYRQTERRAIYQEHAWKLVELGNAFPCFCTSERLAEVRQEQMKNKQNPRYDGLCRDAGSRGSATARRRRREIRDPFQDAKGRFDHDRTTFCAAPSQPKTSSSMTTSS